MILRKLLCFSVIVSISFFSSEIGRAETGLSDAEIIIGSSLPLEGSAQYLGTQNLHGAMAYINSINDSGGVNGRKIKIISYNDGYDPDACLKNTEKLINEDKVFSLFCYVGTPTTAKALPAISAAHIPLIGLFTGGKVFRDPMTREVFNIRSSYIDETGGIIQHFWDDLGLKKIAVFYQDDDYGKAGLAGVELALKKYSSKPVVTATYARGSEDVSEALKTIREAQPDAVVMIGVYGPCAGFIRSAKWSGFNPIFHNVSFVGANELLNLLGVGRDSDGVIVTQVVPPPESELPGVSEYRQLLKKYFPDDKPNFVSLEGFFNAKVLVEALKRAGKDVTRESLITTMESLKNYDAGLGTPISFGADDRTGSDQVYYTIIKDGKYQTIENWTTLMGKK